MGGLGVADAVSMVKGSVGGESPYTRSRNGLKILLLLFEMVQVIRDKILAAGTLRAALYDLKLHHFPSISRRVGGIFVQVGQNGIK
ncbi:mitochondrial aspartate-glutamate transporter agc1 [Neurospora sp. IMI 360204]|nr:mitochondrial aspartate-glutamate transporter agc1 [Neurospora sp. IMI 360204]